MPDKLSEDSEAPGSPEKEPGGSKRDAIDFDKNIAQRRGGTDVKKPKTSNDGSMENKD